MMHSKALKIFNPISWGILLLWYMYMYTYSSWFLFEENWFATVTMRFGSFIAGANSEGDGAIYIFTLYREARPLTEPFLCDRSFKRYPDLFCSYKTYR